MYSFADVTRPEMCKDAVGGGAVGEDLPDVDAAVFNASAWVLGVEEEEKSTRDTWMVRFRRTR